MGLRIRLGSERVVGASGMRLMLQDNLKASGGC
jgi:hypothetical protein